jgi:hypothetical protein
MYTRLLPANKLCLIVVLYGCRLCTATTPLATHPSAKDLRFVQDAWDVMWLSCRSCRYDDLQQDGGADEAAEPWLWPREGRASEWAGSAM